MPTTVTVTKTLYQFNELDDAAKEKARDWFREASRDDEFWEYVYEDAATCADLMGIDLRQLRRKLADGSHRYDPDISFSGFASQGDGACFRGTYKYIKGARVSSHATGDSDSTKELLRIERELRAIQKRYFYTVTANITTSGRYSHAYTMDANFEVHNGERYMKEDDEKDMLQLFRDFANWIYRQLEAEYDYRQSAEQVDESIEANEYTFDEHGNRED